MLKVEDLEVASCRGGKLCGFIFYPHSPRYVSPDRVRNLPSFNLTRVGVFVNQSPEEILEISKIAKLDLIQLHNDYLPEHMEKLDKKRIIKTVWPARFADIESLNLFLEQHSSSASYFLLDAGKNLGGSGKTLDVKFLQNLESPLPWFLAGGLSPQNVEYILNNSSPWGLDVNSGLESSPGVKEHSLMRQFIDKIPFRLNGA